jgi:hypothetical protein
VKLHSLIQKSNICTFNSIPWNSPFSHSKNTYENKDSIKPLYYTPQGTKVHIYCWCWNQTHQAVIILRIISRPKPQSPSQWHANTWVQKWFECSKRPLDASKVRERSRVKQWKRHWEHKPVLLWGWWRHKMEYQLLSESSSQ